MAVNKSYIFLKRVMNLPHEVLCVLGRDGYWKLCFPTDKVVEHFIAQCSKSDSEKIRRQLSQPFFQRTYNKGRVNPLYFYSIDPDSLLKGKEYQGTSLFRVKIEVEGKRQIANLEFVDGRLFSVELPKPIKFYKGKTISFGDVAKGRSSQSFTRAIDQAEHGRNPESD